MTRASRATGRVWRVCVALSLILSTLSFLVTPVGADIEFYSRFDLTKVADPSPVLTSSLLTFTLTITNTGNTTSTSIVITDAVPAETMFVSVGPDGGHDDGLVTWTLSPLAQHEMASVTFTVQTASVAGEVVNASYGVTATNAISPTYGVPVTTAVVAPPEASFSVSNNYPIVGETVVFTNTTVGSEPLTYEWNLGDLSPIITDTHPAHVYTEPGDYTVVLAATNPWGEDTATTDIHVSSPPLPAIVINEIMQNPSVVSDSAGEWFELYNADTTTVDLDGWTIRDDGSNSHIVNGSLPIAPGEYLVLGINGEPGVNGGLEVDYVYSGFTLANDDDEVILLDAESHEIDRVEYDDGATFPDPTGASMELTDPASDNNDGINWREAFTTTVYGYGDLGTPGGPNGIDTLPPFVRDTTPRGGATNVDLGVTIQAVFNEDMNETTVTADVFTLTPSVEGVFSYDDGANTLTFDPDGDLDPNTTYTAAIAGSVTDQAGNPMGEDYSWSFTTGEGVLLPAIVVNEVDADTPGTDALEFVELYDGGVGNTTLDGLVVVFYNGNGDTSYAAFDLDGFSTGANGCFLLGNTSVTPIPDIVFSDNTLQNGTDAVAVYDGDATDFPNGTAVTTASLIDAIVYDTNDADDAGLLVLLNVGQPQVNEGGAGDKDNHSNQRCPNGSGGARNTEAYVQNTPTPGGPNSCDGAPQVASTDPTGGATGVDVNTNVNVTFDEAINTDTLTFTLTGPGGPVPGTVSYNADTTATFDPNDALDFETTYTATIAAGLEDMSGNATVEDYTWSFTTASAGPTITPIHDIQYTEDPSGDSPYLGQTVTTEGVVVAVFDREVIIADPAGGAWNGLLVYADSGHGLVRGDTIRVSGQVIEYNNMTEIGDSPVIELLSPLAPPAPLILPTGDVSQEAYEAVLVQVRDVTVTDPDLGDGEWLVDDGSGGVRVDDKGSYSYMPQQDDQLYAVTGPVFFTYENFKIEPRDDDDVVSHVPAPVLISEVQTAGANGAYDEFVELYNPSPTDVFNLNGYRLVYRSAGGDTDILCYEWSEDASIPPYGHYLLVNSREYSGTVTGDITYTQGLRSDGAGLALRNPDLEIVDSVGWGDATNAFVEGTAPAPGPGSEQSIERLPGGELGNGQDTDDNNADFQLLDPPNPQNTDSPPTPSVVTPIGEARLLPDGTEVMVEGIATAPTGIYYAGGGNTKFYIQDGTGGTQIQVFGSNGPLPEVTLGDLVRVTGLTGHYDNEFQIVPQDNAADITITDGDPEDVPPPMEVAIADVGEGTEGWLIALEGRVVDAWDSGYGYNVRLSDEQGHETRIYIDDATGIDRTGIVIGFVQRFVGISSQYDDIYETKPRIQEDVPEWPNQQGPCPAPAATTPGPLIISAVHYDTTYLGYDELAEAVQVINTGDEAISLAGLYLSDNEASVALPDLWLEPGQKVWLARDAPRFALEFGFAPAWTYGDLAPDLLFDNAGDEALLLNQAGAVVDAIVIEGGCAVEQSGWNDSAGVYPYLFAFYVSTDGQILYRKLGEATGQPVPDTDSATDWAQDPADGVLGRKMLYPGWDLDQFFFPPTVTENATITLLVAPDNIYDGIAGLIAEAETTIDIELYVFSHPILADELVAAMDRGVHVRLLLEGEVYSAPDGIWDGTRWVAKQVYEHLNGEVYFWRDGQDDEGLALADRYNNVHQKFLIVDGVKAAILSENLRQSSMPHDDKSDGTAGHRGAGIITTAPGVVAHLQAVFAADFDPANHRDVTPFTPGRDDVCHEEGHEGEPLVRPDEKGNLTGYMPVHPESLTLSGPVSFEVVQSPDTCLRTTDALLGMVARADAGDLVLAQQQYEHQNWGPDGAEYLNPRLNAYIEAARRWASVRIMVANNDDNTYEDDLIQYLNDLATDEGLDLMAGKGLPTAGWLDREPEGGHIHSKMVLVYDGDTQGWVHVGSINGSENSSRYNREMALQLGSDEAFNYYANVFHADWVASDLPAFLEAPVASFEVSTDTPRVGETVSFINTTTGSRPILYEWDFGDGSPASTQVHPDHAYDAPGVYEVTLHAVNAVGQSSATVEIHVGYPPEAAFAVSNDYPAVDEQVFFTNETTGGEPLFYEWTFGDGATSEQTNPTHAYKKAGNYVVTLTAVNPWGEDTATAEVHVGYPPVAAFSASPTTPLPGEKVRFTNKSTGTEPLTYLWDLGDGETSEEVNPTHVYFDPGIYVVTLTARNPWGQDTATGKITVYQPLGQYIINHMAIHWHQSKDKANFALDGRLKLPPSYSLKDLTGRVILSIKIDGKTVWQEANLTSHGRLWYLEGTGHSEGLDLRHMCILWMPYYGQKIGRFGATGKFYMPGVGPDTKPSKATITLKLLTKPGKPPVFGREKIGFKTYKRWWLYSRWR